MNTMETGKALLAIVHNNPLDATAREVLSDWCEEFDQAWAAEPLRNGRIPLLNHERDAIEVLKLCNFAPATWDKRFARNLDSDARSLTPRQYMTLWVLLRKYRRSVTHDAIKAEAEKRYQRYKELLALGVHVPSYQPDSENDRTQEFYRKRRHKAKMERQAKEIDAPLFD